MVNKNEKNLLNWALSNSSADQPAQNAKSPVLDEELMEAILGKSEAKQMRECVEFASNSENALPDRLSLLDELEMLVESIDNANDIEQMGLWPKIFSLLESSKEGEDKIKVATLWVIGTAAQNNPKAQQALLKYNVLEAVFGLLASPQSDIEVKKKAFYVISSMAKPVNSPGHDAFIKFNGPAKLTELKEDADVVICDRIDFLLNFLQSCNETQ
jgi:hsp70-interacting protein